MSPDARIGKDVELAPGVVIGPGAEIGDGTRLGPGTVIGPGVAIGRNCEIGANVAISHAYIGDRVTILPGAQIGQPGFGFATSGADYLKIPQLGRVIVQDDAVPDHARRWDSSPRPAVRMPTSACTGRGTTPSRMSTSIG